MKGARLLLAIWALAVAGPAWGHAFLERAEPRVGSTVKAAPTQVRAWFTQNLEPAFRQVDEIQKKKLTDAEIETFLKDDKLLKEGVRRAAT